MKPKTLNILFWTLTLLFAVLMMMDGISGVMHVEAGKEVMLHLGYPMYLLTICGLAKIVGALAIVQPWWRSLREWAYAGFTINFIGAMASRAFAGDPAAWMIPPVVVLAFMLVTYFLWKKLEKQRSGGNFSQ